jgi:hypothetical protein
MTTQQKIDQIRRLLFAQEEGELLQFFNHLVLHGWVRCQKHQTLYQVGLAGGCSACAGGAGMAPGIKLRGEMLETGEAGEGGVG